MHKIASYSTLAALAVTLGLATSLGASPAKADSCPQPGNRNITAHCYYLPTVSNGRVNGLREETTYSFKGPGPYGHGGAVIGHGYGTPPVVPRVCRNLPTVAGGRVTGVHQVCS